MAGIISFNPRKNPTAYDYSGSFTYEKNGDTEIGNSPSTSELVVGPGLKLGQSQAAELMFLTTALYCFSQPFVGNLLSWQKCRIQRQGLGSQEFIFLFIVQITM